MNHKRVSDLALVGTLKILGHTIVSLDRTDSRRVVFCFVHEDGMDEKIQDYFNDHLLVNPRLFFSALRELKTQLYNTSL